MKTASPAPESPAIAWADDDLVHKSRYLLDSERVLGPVMLLPAVIYILALVGFPLVLAVIYSLSDVSIADQSINWVGLRNFRAVWGDDTFRTALRNTIVFTVVSQIIVIIGATILSQVLAADFHGKRFVRFLILLPWTTPIALAVLGWLWMLDNVYSPIDALMRDLGLLGPHTMFGPTRNMHWLSRPELAQASVITIYVWRTLPLATVIILAGLAAIPRDIEEAADVDGAGYWRKLFFIDLPLLTPIVAVAVLYGVIFTFTDMIVVYILTGGGPVNQTQVLASWAFYKGINGTDLAQGAAIALFLLPVLVAAAIAMLRLARRAETV